MGNGIHGFSSGSGNENVKAGKLPDNEYWQKQMELKSKIKPQAENIKDLYNAADIKKQQIALAQRQGDVQSVNGLIEDLKKIEADIRKNYSVFSQEQYHNAQMQLSEQIKPQAENMNDLMTAAMIKMKQIDLAMIHGDKDLAHTLSRELSNLPKNSAESVEDLEFAARVKAKLIEVAEFLEDPESAEGLNNELTRINNDLNEHPQFGL